MGAVFMMYACLSIYLGRATRYGMPQLLKYQHSRSLT